MERESPAGYIIKLEQVKRCPITVGDGIIDRMGSYFDLGPYSSIAIITDRAVRRLYGQILIKTLEAAGKKVHLFALPAGERAKSLNSVERGYRFLLENSIDRRGLICALGGGVVGDTAGYIAASYLRGIDYIQLPTTLLAQVDSSIGGKVGINFSGQKNMVGSFYQPRAIISDVALLKTLPPAEVRNGLAEVIKYGLAMDEGLFRLLEQKEGKEFTTAELREIVMRCCRLKAGVVERDETDRTGERAILNFGHTTGHAIEAATGLKELKHGQAVAIGMAAAARISTLTGRLERSNIDRIENLLLRFGLPVRCQGVSPEELASAIRFDKKTTSGRTGWVLLNGIGQGVTNQMVPEDLVIRVLKEVCR